MRLELTYRAKFIFMLDEPLTKIEDYILILNRSVEFFNKLKKTFKENNLKVEIYGSEDDYSTFVVDTDNQKNIKLLKNLGFQEQEQEEDEINAFLKKDVQNLKKPEDTNDSKKIN